MIRSSYSWLWALASTLIVWFFAQQCQAHFLWVKTLTENGKPHAFLFFGENVLDEAYHLPESLAASKVWIRTKAGKRVSFRSSRGKARTELAWEHRWTAKACMCWKRMSNMASTGRLF